MRVKWSKYLVLLTVCFFISGCQKMTLSEEEEAFSGKGLTYAFQLPMGWEVDKKPEATFTPEAVFGAEDTQNQAVMFVRVHHQEEGKTLAAFTKELLEDYYNMEGLSGDSFEVGEETSLHYRLYSKYRFHGEPDTKDVWLDVYMVPIENTIVEFQYYSTKDNRSEDRQGLFESSAASVTVTGAAKTADTTTTERKAVSDDLTLQITTYRTEEQADGSRILILRYLSTNQGQETMIPAEAWEECITITENGNLLQTMALTKEEQEQTELTYLVQAGQKPLANGQSIESAVVYGIKKDTTTMTITFDKETFPQMKPLELTIK